MDKMKIKDFKTVDIANLGETIVNNEVVLENKAILYYVKVYNCINSMTDADLSKFKEDGLDILGAYDHIIKDGLWAEFTKSAKMKKLIIELDRYIEIRYEQLYVESREMNNLETVILEYATQIRDKVMMTLDTMDMDKAQDILKNSPALLDNMKNIMSGFGGEDNG